MKHYIIVKFKENVDWNGMLPAIKELFQTALAIDGVNQVEVHCSNSGRPNRHDLMIEMRLTPEGLAVYDSSQMHRDWKTQYGQYIEQKTIFDCEE
ncbi:MAG: Dabb family protein [Lachnospiraceae bacterium]|nr:Dabb family protein [Lachnospiraceae bacterium]